MKKFACLILTLLFVNLVFSQADPDLDNHGGFCSFSLGFRSVENKYPLVVGGEGGFIVKEFRLGGYFFGNSHSINIVGLDGNQYNLSEMQGGFYLGYPFFAEHSFHMVADLKLGYGTSRLVNTNVEYFDRVGFIGITPSVALEYSLSEIFKLAVGIDFQYHIKFSTPEFYDQSILNQPGIYAALVIGLF